MEKKNFISLEETAISQNKGNEKELFVCWGIYFLISIALLLPLAYYSNTMFSRSIINASKRLNVTIATILQTYI